MNVPAVALFAPFMLHAIVAGSAVAAAAGVVGYLLVLRRQMFTGDALSHVAFTGALAGLAAGIDPRLGLYAATVGIAVGMAALGERGEADDVVIGGVFAWVLGVGALFLSWYSNGQSGGNGAAGVNVLFGSLLGLTAPGAAVAVVVALGAVAAVVVLARPLVFASIDESVAAARGIPVRALGIVFLGVVGVVAAAATQAVGALLLLGLLAAPAGAAARLTARPFAAMALSAAIAMAGMWAGLGVSASVPRVPPSFGIIAVLSAVYAAVAVVTRGR